MSEGEERVYAIGLRKTGKPGGKIDDNQRRAARRGRAFPREQHGERRRIELLERRAIHLGCARSDPRQTASSALLALSCVSVAAVSKRLTMPCRSQVADYVA